MRNSLMEIPEELRSMIDVEQEKDRKVTDSAKKRKA
jgi:hypothetical protein